MSQISNKKFIFVISDGTGRSAFQMLEAALAQFSHTPVYIKTYSAIQFQDMYRLEGIVENAAFLDAIIAFTLVIPEMQETLRNLCAKYHVTCIDMIGPVLLHLSNWLEREPSHSPDPSLDGDNYFQRVMALDFALRHDDGKNPPGLIRAELVLVGVSRSSKTPLSVYLSYRGWMVGNVPLVPGVDLPEVLFDLPLGRVIGLTMRPDRMKRLRDRRQARLGYEGDYNDIRTIRDEIARANAIYEEAGWPVVDMTYKSIEEAGTEILEHLERISGEKRYISDY